MAINTEARRPQFDGVTDSEWSAPNWEDYVAGYYKHHPDATRPDQEVQNVDDAPAAMKTWASSLSFLGNADAETFADLVFFPVVNPDTLNLNKNALIAVVSGRGAQADISDDQLASARRMAYRLLVENWDDWSNEDVPEEYKSSKSLGESLADTIREKAEKVKNM